MPTRQRPGHSRALSFPAAKVDRSGTATLSQYGGRIEAPELLRQVHSSLEGYTVNIEESGEINAHGMAKQTPRDIAATERSGRPVDWLHWATVIVAFGITGMLSLLFSRFLLTGVLHLEGGLWPGP